MPVLLTPSAGEQQGRSGVAGALGPALLHEGPVKLWGPSRGTGAPASSSQTDGGQSSAVSEGREVSRVTCPRQHSGNPWLPCGAF